MPSRLIDFEALWSSDKLAACAEWSQAEYAWLYGLADAHGSFELSSLRVICGRVAAIRKNLSLERLEQIFEEFHANGLLFIWEANGKKYGHWTGSDREGRLPPPSQRDRYKKFAPPVPKDQLAAYLQAFSRRDVQPHLESPPGQAGEHPDDIRSTSGAPPDREGLNREGLGKGRKEGAPANSAPAARAEPQPSPCWAFQGIHVAVTQRQDRLLAEGFPWVDRQAEYRKADSWLEGNPNRRPKRIVAFLHNWFSKIPSPSNGGKGASRAEQRTRNNLRAAGFIA